MHKKTLDFIYAVVVLAALLGGFGLWLHVSNAELQQLNESRKNIFSQVRPAFLQFREENGRFPKTLEELVPKYLPSIHPELQLDGFPSIKSGHIIYEGDNENAVFSFRYVHGPDGNAKYDVVKNKYWYEQ